MGRKPDFCGWATKNDLLCADGRIIRRNAFKENDGQRVPLVYMHNHVDPMNVLGHALLENRKDGVYCYCYLNNSDQGRHMREAIRHGDLTGLSIYANKLVQKGSDVLHGVIREVSIVLGGANPGAYIENPILIHGEGTDHETYEDDLSEAIIYSGEEPELYHADFDDDDLDEDDEDYESEDETMTGGRTYQDVIDEMDDEQLETLHYVVGAALEDQAAEYEDAIAELEGEYDEDEEYDDEDLDDEDLVDEDYDEDEDEEMRHNVFEGDYEGGDYLSHADFEQILSDARSMGSLRDAVEAHMESGVLAHAIDTSNTAAGVSYATGNGTYGINDMDMLFPEFREINTPPEWIRRPADWVAEFFANVHRTPFSRIKSTFADLTEDEARAKGYIKGNMKKEQVFSLLKRTTDPQTVYKKQKMDRDDVIDITDFDVVAWIKSEMRGQLDEEIARACLIGDGRLNSSDDKISEDHIRPVLMDNPLFTIRHYCSGTPRSIINSMIKARKTYRGSGNPIAYVSTDTLNDMLLMTDETGRDLFKSVGELATKCRVRKFTEVEQMEGLKYNSKDVLAIILNPADYNIGADKGGSVNLFDDFDIDYNQMKYLIETRCSGALTKPYSAIVILKDSNLTGNTDAATVNP